MKRLFLAGVIALLDILFPFQNALAQTPDTVHIHVCPKLWSTGEPVADVMISISSFGPMLPPPLSLVPEPGSTCALLTYVPNDLPPGTTFSFEGTKDGDIANGVNVLDLICISRHVLGLEPLPTFGQIAADVNKSGSITTYDIVEAHNVVQGIYMDWPANSSWRFLNADCAFPDPSNPFGGILNCPVYQVGDLADGDTVTLIGIKTGDANGDANPSGPYAGLNTTDSVTLLLPDQALEPGLVFNVPLILAGGGLPVHGVQGAFSFDPAVLSVEDIFTTAYSNSGNFGVFNDHLSFSITSSGGLPDDTPIAMVQFKALGTGNLATALTLNPAFTFPMATGPGCNNGYHLGASFSDIVAQHEPPAALAVRLSPNPFQEETALMVDLAQSVTVRLEVFDALGRPTYAVEKQLPAGRALLEIPGAAVQPGGLGFYRLSAGNAVATGKLLRK